MTEPLSTAVGRLILVRLLVPSKRGVTRADLKKALEPFLQQRHTPAEAAALINAALSELCTAGLAVAQPLGVTEAGRKQALEFLGVDSLPSRLDWRRLRNAFLLPSILGLATPEARKRLTTADGLRAALLRKSNALAIAEVPTLSQALHALAWKQLGVDTSAAFTIEAVLARTLGIEGKPNRRRVGELLPVKAVGARNSRADELRLAVICRWLEGGTHSPPPSSPHETPAFDLAGFARAVQEAAGAATSGRFGEHKVFIAHVWRQLREQHVFPTMDEAQFRLRLVEAHCAGLLALSRADLVEAMDPEDVRSSETAYRNATFHFVQI